MTIEGRIKSGLLCPHPVIQVEQHILTFLPHCWEGIKDPSTLFIQSYVLFTIDKYKNMWSIILIYNFM
jgi:hypothetical protein